MRTFWCSRRLFFLMSYFWDILSDLTETKKNPFDVYFWSAHFCVQNGNKNKPMIIASGAHLYFRGLNLSPLTDFVKLRISSEMDSFFFIPSPRSSEAMGIPKQRVLPDPVLAKQWISSSRAGLRGDQNKFRGLRFFYSSSNVLRR